MGESFYFDSFYLLVLRKITNLVSKINIFLHGGKLEIFFYHMYLRNMLEQKICPNSSLRVKLMYESVKYDMLIYFLIEKIDCPA